MQIKCYMWSIQHWQVRKMWAWEEVQVGARICTQRKVQHGHLSGRFEWGPQLWTPESWEKRLWRRGKKEGGQFGHSIEEPCKIRTGPGAPQKLDHLKRPVGQERLALNCFFPRGNPRPWRERKQKHGSLGSRAWGASRVEYWEGHAGQHFHLAWPLSVPRLWGEESCTQKPHTGQQERQARSTSLPQFLVFTRKKLD